MGSVWRRLARRLVFFAERIPPKAHKRHTQRPVLCYSDGARAPRTNLVNKMPRQAMMPLITSNDVNRSYVLFRLTGEGDQIPGGSAGYMPVGGSKLGTSPMCQWINWIKSGTPP